MAASPSRSKAGKSFQIPLLPSGGGEENFLWMPALHDSLTLMDILDTDRDKRLDELDSGLQGQYKVDDRWPARRP
ncbi:hypothetical protein H8959_018897 [Pygathrix nigripes]